LYWEEDGYGFTGSIGHFSIAPKLEINNMVWDASLIMCLIE
jgi:hypothetical protein